MCIFGVEEGLRVLKKVLIVAATEAEADALRKILGIDSHTGCYTIGNCESEILVTGVGSAATSWSMMKWLCSNPKPELVINIGIAGSFRNDIAVGEVVIPVSDCFADAGIETEEGFVTLYETGLGDPPVNGGIMVADNHYVRMATDMLKPVNAVTVNTVSGSRETIERLLGKFNPDIETMEGATFFYICLREKIPFIALRSISNMVEPRNKKKWNIQLAVNNMSESLKDFLLML